MMSNDASVSSGNFDSDIGYEESTMNEAVVDQSPAPSELPTTKVTYHVDKETPFVTTIDCPLSQLTLGVFKKVLPKSTFKFYNLRPEDGIDVKFELFNDADPILPSSRGTVDMYLLSEETSSCVSDVAFTSATAVVQQRQSNFRQPSYSNRNRYSSQRASSSRRQSQPKRKSTANYGRYHEEPTYFDETNLYPDSEVRAWSDDSTAFTDFTSVSQQRVGRSRARRERQAKKPHRYESHFPNISCSDASMAIDLITLEFEPQARIPLGLRVLCHRDNRGDNGIYVNEIVPNSVAAMDGRVKPGMMILEVNDFPLSNYSNDEAMKLLTNELKSKHRPVRLTFAQTEKDRFVLPTEDVMPINTGHWVEQQKLYTQYVYDEAPRTSNAVAIFNPHCLNAGGFPSSGVGTSITSDSTYSPPNHYRPPEPLKPVQPLGTHNSQKPALDDTLVQRPKGITSAIKKFFCIGPNSSKGKTKTPVAPEPNCENAPPESFPPTKFYNPRNYNTHNH